jgi:hypothetical protein
MGDTKPEGNINKADIEGEFERLLNEQNPSSHQSPFQIEDTDIEQLLCDAEVFVDQEFDNADALLSSDSPFGVLPMLTPGNLSTIGGKPKTSKTTFAGIEMIALHRGFSQLKGSLQPSRNGIIYIDLEMGSRRTKGLAELIRTVGGFETLPTNMRFFSLRQYNTKTRLSILEYIAFQWPNTAVIFVDGARDLVLDINSGGEIALLMEKLLFIIEKTNVHICSIIHFNKADRNLRGVLGTEFANKSELVISLDKHVEAGEAFFSVKADLSRDKEFPAFAFQRNDNSITILEEWGSKSKKESIKIQDISEEKLNAILKAAFSDSEEFSYMDLVSAMQQKAVPHIGTLGLGKAKQLVQHCYALKRFSTRRVAQKTMYRLDTGTPV